MTEREIKLALPGRFAIPELSVGDVSLAPEALPPLNLHATYYDTPDLRLARHGLTLRYRTGESVGPRWTLKLPTSGSGGAILSREEIHFSGSRREPPEEARDLVTAYIRRYPLVAVATLRTKRRRWRFSHDGAAVVEVADDEVSVLEGRRIVSRFRELELEAMAEDAPLDALADQLRSAGAADAEPVPKVVRALGSRATAPPDVREPSLPADPTLGHVVSLAISDALLRLLRNDPSARLGDAEGLHQLRVALRRLRSDLRTLADVMDPEWWSRIEPRLTELAHALAEARDLDVMIDGLDRDLDAPRSSLAPLFRTLERRRRQARDAVSHALGDAAYAELLDELVSAASRPPVTAEADASVEIALPNRVIPAWDRLARRADKLRPSSPDDDFHRTRIAAKRARYAAELGARALDGKRSAGAARLAAKLAEIQDQLGTLQNTAVAEAAIRATLSNRATRPGYPFEAGRLVERQRQRGTEARHAFFDTWRDLRRRRWRKWAVT